MTLEGLKYFLTKRHGWFFFLMSRGLTDSMSDERFLKASFRYSMDQELDLNNPKTFNQKLQWLKLYDRRPLYTQMVDKYAVRELIAEKIGDQYSIPLVGGPWERPEDIDFDASGVLSGARTLDQSAGELMELIAGVASGRPTCAEALGHREYFIPYKYQDRPSACKEDAR